MSKDYSHLIKQLRSIDLEVPDFVEDKIFFALKQKSSGNVLSFWRKSILFKFALAGFFILFTPSLLTYSYLNWQFQNTNDNHLKRVYNINNEQYLIDFNDFF